MQFSDSCQCEASPSCCCVAAVEGIDLIGSGVMRPEEDEVPSFMPQSHENTLCYIAKVPNRDWN